MSKFTPTMPKRKAIVDASESFDALSKAFEAQLGTRTDSKVFEAFLQQATGQQSFSGPGPFQSL